MDHDGRPDEELRCERAGEVGRRESRRWRSRRRVFRGGGGGCTRGEGRPGRGLWGGDSGRGRGGCAGPRARWLAVDGAPLVGRRRQRACSESARARAQRGRRGHARRRGGRRRPLSCR
eukprot:5380518-Pleurochrysis_carterae.AAC.2